jgi:hypothetical protein
MVFILRIPLREFNSSSSFLLKSTAITLNPSLARGIDCKPLPDPKSTAVLLEKVIML